MRRSHNRPLVDLLIIVGVLFGSVVWPSPTGAVATAPGDVRWAAAYDGPTGGDDSGDFIQVSPDGSTVFVTGTSDGIEEDYATVAYDSAIGIPRWVGRYNGPLNHFDRAAGSAISPDGSSLFVTGTTLGEFTFDDYATVAFDASTGTKRWARHFDGTASGPDTAEGIAASPDGSLVFVTGTSRSQRLYDDDFATVAYQASTGAVAWARRASGGGGKDIPHAITPSPDGSRVFVTGVSPGPSGIDDIFTVAYDAASGSLLWSRRYAGPDEAKDVPVAMVASPDGSTVFITGGASGEDFDYLTVAYDAASGEVRWAKRYEGPRTGARDIASSIAIAPDGSSVYVTGGSTSPDRSLDYATLAYEASTGTMRWVRRFGVRIIGSGDGARAVAVSPDGSKVLVTGRSYRGDISGRDMATIEYDASTGAIVWVRLYGHLLHESERATSLAVSPDGSTVFVTGNRFHNDGYDFATVAYEI